MGGIGISNGNTWHLNTINPALLYHNQLSTFEFGLTGESRTLSSDISTSTIGSGGLKYLGLGIPVTDPVKTDIIWTMAITLSPYSTVNYDVFTFQESPGPEGDSLVVNRTGTGGLVQASWAHGVKLFKNFSLGVKASYVFGNITRESANQLFYPEEREVLVGNEIEIDTIYTTDYKIVISERESYSDWAFELGAAYKYELSETESINLGATYEFETAIQTELFSKLERRDANNSLSGFNADTLEVGLRGDVVIPARLGLGISYSKQNSFTIGFDYLNQNWTNYRSFDQEFTSFQNSHSFALGAEFIPDISSAENYLKRITYRFGLEFDKTPYMVQNESINEFGINFGLSMPVSGFSNVNLAFKYGQLGTTDSGLIKEEYFNFAIGASFNTNRWKKLPRFN